MNSFQNLKLLNLRGYFAQTEQFRTGQGQAEIKSGKVFLKNTKFINN
jgi:hypothetical protein